MIYHIRAEDDAAGIREPEGVPLSGAAITRVLDEMAIHDA